MLGASLPTFLELTMALCVESDIAGGFIQSMRDGHMPLEIMSTTSDRTSRSKPC
jgi:hypothetical protein